MRKRLSNVGEDKLHREISPAVDGFGASIYRKIRLADVVDISGLPSSDLRRYALQSHFDVCIADSDEQPAFAIEYDGGGHDARNDERKNEIARQADLALFRIDERLLSRKLGDYTFLQYLVHVWFMGRAFREAQEAGQIDPSEPFMMTAFLRPDAKNIFDSAYDFARPPLARIGKKLVRAGLAKPPLSSGMMGISFSLMARDDSSFIGFGCIRFGDHVVWSRAKLDIGTPSLGELVDVPFGWSALSDFCEGMAYDGLADSLDIIESGGRHALLTRQEVAEEMIALRQNGYSDMRSFYSSNSADAGLFGRIDLISP
jgi:hypothetical protein